MDLATDALVPLAARTGKSIPSVVEIESDGELAILSRYETGYRSAHRDHAQRHFGKALWCMNRVSWINANGVRVVLTRWNTQEFRTRPVTNIHPGKVNA